MPDNVSDEGSPNDPLKTVADALEKAVQTAAESAGDAKATAEKTLPAAGRFLSRVVYAACYSISYSVVLPTVWVARSIPPDNPVVEGLTEGAKAAIEAVEEWQHRRLAAPSVEPSPPHPP